MSLLSLVKHSAFLVPLPHLISQRLQVCNVVCRSNQCASKRIRSPTKPLDKILASISRNPVRLVRDKDCIFESLPILVCALPIVRLLERHLPLAALDLRAVRPRIHVHPPILAQRSLGVPNKQRARVSLKVHPGCSELGLRWFGRVFFIFFDTGHLRGSIPVLRLEQCAARELLRVEEVREDLLVEGNAGSEIKGEGVGHGFCEQSDGPEVGVEEEDGRAAGAGVEVVYAGEAFWWYEELEGY